MPSAKLTMEGTTTIHRASAKTCFGMGRSGAVINWPRTTADASRRSRMSVSCFCAPNDRLAIGKRTNPRLTRYLGSERELDFIGCLTRRSVGCADSFLKLLRVPVEALSAGVWSHGEATNWNPVIALRERAASALLFE